MAEDTVLVAQKRDAFGSSECRRLRNSGSVPGNVYGHGKGTVSIKTNHEDVLRIVSEGHIAVDLDLGEPSPEKAIFREVQWDTFGKKIVHFDLLRVDPDEKISIEVPVVLKGTAPGVAQGGILDVQLHTLSVTCLVYKIPDSIPVRVGTLGVGDMVRVSELTLPEGVEVTNHPEEIVVQISETRAMKAARIKQETGIEDTDIEHPEEVKKEGSAG
ncbi:MAG TPA: 50S ribosomal protein L25 [Planctomycetaceae bacterium]|nr:50S ribosomal protein L25 [Planctomycetaceae bacterium]